MVFLQVLHLDLSDLAASISVCLTILDSDQLQNQKNDQIQITQQYLLMLVIGIRILTFLLFLAANFQNADCWTPQAQNDRVQQLFGFMNFTGKFQMFSGYLDIQGEPRISIFYLFLTSMSKPRQDDLVLWLNGGPGCSSLQGFSQQVGPNMLFPGSTSFSASPNPYSWSNQANLLFFQSPAGTGYSINRDPGFIHNQSRTADNNLAALKAWYTRFPEMQTNRLWITGQSYAGMFIPNLASVLLDANERQEVVAGGRVQFQGVMIGNGVLISDRRWRKKVRNQFYARHYYFGPEIGQLLAYCKYDDSDASNPSCIRGTQLATDSIKYLNPYATTGICYKQPQTALPSANPFQYKNQQLVFQGFRLSQGLRAGNFSPCTQDASMENYFNLPQVKQQLHVDPSLIWQDCNLSIGYGYQRDNTSLTLFEKMKQNKLRVLLYSGNTDAVVSHVETSEHVKTLGWKVVKEKRPFGGDRGSLMGWWTEYEGLTLVTINGAGHMAPGDKPHAVATMFEKFRQQASQPQPS